MSTVPRGYYGRQVTAISYGMVAMIIALGGEFSMMFGFLPGCAAATVASLFSLGISQIICAMREIKSDA